MHITSTTVRTARTLTEQRWCQRLTSKTTEDRYPYELFVPLPPQTRLQPISLSQYLMRARTAPVREQGCTSRLWQPLLSNPERFAALISRKHVNRAAIKANVQHNTTISSGSLQNALEDCRVTVRCRHASAV